MFSSIQKIALTGCIALIAGLPASADSLLVYKLGVNASGGNAISDVTSSWQNSGGFNEGNLTAESLSDSTMDYKNSWVDTNWSQVLSVDVGMYDANGNEVAHIDFSPGTSKSDFYTAGDILSSNYTDLGFFSGNFFGEFGDSNRRWFINNNYGGCPSDVGWFVVDINGGQGCNPWETSRFSGANRAFLFAEDDVRQNWTSGDIGQAAVFAITVTTADSAAPEPSTLVLFGTALAGLAFVVRRKALAAHS